MHKFVILNNGKIETYNNYKDIPMEFDNVIEFLPHIPPPPHNEDQHEEIESWNKKLRDLMKRERGHKS
jgi:hypothetical protein